MNKRFYLSSFFILLFACNNKANQNETAKPKENSNVEPKFGVPSPDTGNPATSTTNPKTTNTTPTTKTNTTPITTNPSTTTTTTTTTDPTTTTTSPFGNNTTDPTTTTTSPFGNNTTDPTTTTTDPSTTTTTTSPFGNNTTPTTTTPITTTIFQTPSFSNDLVDKYVTTDNKFIILNFKQKVNIQSLYYGASDCGSNNLINSLESSFINILNGMKIQICKINAPTGSSNQNFSSIMIFQKNAELYNYIDSHSIYFDFINNDSMLILNHKCFSPTTGSTESGESKMRNQQNPLPSSDIKLCSVAPKKEPFAINAPDSKASIILEQRGINTSAIVKFKYNNDQIKFVIVK